MFIVIVPDITIAAFLNSVIVAILHFFIRDASKIALNEFVNIGKVIEPNIPVGLWLVWEFFSAKAARIRLKTLRTRRYR